MARWKARYEARRRAAAPSPEHAPPALALVVESRLERWRQHKTLVDRRRAGAGVFHWLAATNAAGPGRQDRRYDRAALRARFLRRRAAATGPGSSHAMIRDAVYQTLLRDDRRVLHSIAADTLNARYLGLGSFNLDVLAQHLVEQATCFLEAIQLRAAASADTVARGCIRGSGGSLRSGACRRRQGRRAKEGSGECSSSAYSSSWPGTDRPAWLLRTDKWKRCIARRAPYAASTTEAAMLYQIMRGLTALNLVRGNRLVTGYDLSLQAMEIAEKIR